MRDIWLNDLLRMFHVERNQHSRTADVPRGTLPLPRQGVWSGWEKRDLTAMDGQPPRDLKGRRIRTHGSHSHHIGGAFVGGRAAQLLEADGFYGCGQFDCPGGLA